MEKVTSENYVQKALRSEDLDLSHTKEKLQNDHIVRLLHASFGMITEVGEFADNIKRHLFYNEPLNIGNAKEELGDQTWYIGLAIDVLKTTMDEIMTKNIEKLKIRYPEKFEFDKSVNRNLKEEEKIFNKI